VAEELVAGVEGQVVVAVVQVPLGAVGVSVLGLAVEVEEQGVVKPAVEQVLQTGIQRNMQMQCRQL